MKNLTNYLIMSLFSVYPTISIANVEVVCGGSGVSVLFVEGECDHRELNRGGSGESQMWRRDRGHCFF